MQLFRRLLAQAHDAEQAKRNGDLSEEVERRLRTIFPAEDIAVLHRYRLTETIESVNVNVDAGGDLFEMVEVKLPVPIAVPKGRAPAAFCGGHGLEGDRGGFAPVILLDEWRGVLMAAIAERKRMELRIRDLRTLLAGHHDGNSLIRPTWRFVYEAYKELRPYAE